MRGKTIIRCINKNIEIKGADFHFDIGDDCEYLHQGDFLWSPRTQQKFRVMEKPISPIIKVIEFAPQSYIYTHDVAKYFGVSSRAVVRWCREGHIPAEKIKGQWHIDIIMTSDQPPDVIAGDQLIILGSVFAEVYKAE